jgi:ribokinase
MEHRPILACGAMNLDQTYRITWEAADRFLEGLVTRGGETVLRGDGGRIVAWLKKNGAPLGSFPGGSAANTAFALTRLGVPVAFCGCVGDDEAGRFLVASLERVDASRLSRRGATGLCLILVDEDGERSILKMPGANDLWEPPDGGCRIAGGWAGVHLTALSSEDGPQRQADLLAGAGPVPFVSLDPGELYAARGPLPLGCLLSRSTHLFLNRRELKLLFGDPPDRSALFAPPRRLVMVKSGPAGLELEGTEGEAAVPPYPVVAIDTTGAGDAAAAGYLTAERLGWDLASRGLLAARCGALATTRAGRGGYPDSRVLAEVARAAAGPEPGGWSLPA